MGQVTIYLDAKTEKKLQEAAKKNGISLSKWVANLIREKTATTWPDSIAELAGAWKDMATAEKLREEAGDDLPRETL
jgi:predicted transcriptional regulator